MITGSGRRCWSARMRSSSSTPSMRGMLMSSSISRGRVKRSRSPNGPSLCRYSSASTPSRTRSIGLARLTLRRWRSMSRAWPSSSSTSRIFTGCCRCSILFLPFLSSVGRGQREPERAAFAERRLDPDSAALFLHDPLHRGETDAVAGHGVTADAAEQAEDLRLILRPDPDPVVAHEEAWCAVAGHAADVDRRCAAWLAVFHRVVDEVAEDLIDPHRVADHRRQGVHLHGDAALTD